MMHLLILFLFFLLLIITTLTFIKLGWFNPIVNFFTFDEINLEEKRKEYTDAIEKTKKEQQDYLKKAEKLKEELKKQKSNKTL